MDKKKTNSDDKEININTNNVFKFCVAKTLSKTCIENNGITRINEFAKNPNKKIYLNKKEKLKKLLNNKLKKKSLLFFIIIVSYSR